MALAFDLFSRHEERLSGRLLDFLHKKPGIRIIGEISPSRALRVPTICFVQEGRKSDDIVSRVDPHKVAIRFGDFYAKKLIHDLGLETQNGVVRVSMVHYNTLEEVDRLIAALETIL
jgi:selenocysteine lyase/cysteine desulfurase